MLNWIYHKQQRKQTFLLYLEIKYQMSHSLILAKIVMKLPFDSVFEVGLADSAVIKKYGGTWAVLPSHWARMMLEFTQTHTIRHKYRQKNTCIYFYSAMGDRAYASSWVACRDGIYVWVHPYIGPKVSLTSCNMLMEQFVQISKFHYCPWNISRGSQLNSIVSFSKTSEETKDPTQLQSDICMPF